MFLLNECPAAQQIAQVRDGAEALEEMGALVSPFILARLEYQEAARLGSGVTELNPCGAAAEEIRDLWLSLGRRLAFAKVGRSVRVAA